MLWLAIADVLVLHSHQATAAHTIHGAFLPLLVVDCPFQQLKVWQLVRCLDEFI